MSLSINDLDANSTAWGTAGLVPGLKLRVSAEELRKHMMDRAAHHERRRDEKQALLPQLEDAAAKIKSQQPAALVAQFSKSVSNYRFDGDDAVQQLKGDIESHNNKAVAFRWLAGHLFDQDYCLNRNDLVELEILKR